jgi:hypothetical protein
VLRLMTKVQPARDVCYEHEHDAAEFATLRTPSSRHRRARRQRQSCLRRAGMRAAAGVRDTPAREDQANDLAWR